MSNNEIIEGAIVTTESVPFGAMTMPSSKELVSKAVEVSNELKAIILKNRLSVQISGREYVKAEGWSTLGGLLGITVHERVDLCSRFDDGTWQSVVELVRGSDGAIVGRASAICSPDERWGKGKDAYAIKSMSLTRATGKAFRLSFSWIMQLAGYAPTPAEEMYETEQEPQDEGYTKPKPTTKVETHWAHGDLKGFWAWTKNELHLNEAEVHDALEVESVRQFLGTKAEAVSLLEEYADLKFGGVQ